MEIFMLSEGYRSRGYILPSSGSSDPDPPKKNDDDHSGVYIALIIIGFLIGWFLKSNI